MPNLCVKLRTFLIISVVLSGITFYGCNNKTTHKNTVNKIADEIKSPFDKPLDEFQVKLLELSFQTATKIPIKPHIKDRSRSQEDVLLTCIELDQPVRALSYIEQIDNWRRGSCYADLAFYYAQHGFEKEALKLLSKAQDISETTEDWRRDRIRVKIAKTYAWMGQTQKADEFEAGVVDSETGKVAQVDAMRSDENSFEEQKKELDALIATDNFDVLKNALDAYAQLYDRFYNNQQRRMMIEEKIKTSWGKFPIFLRIQLLMDLATISLDHSYRKNALELVNEAQTLIDEYEWKLEHRLPLMAKIIRLRYQTGHQQKAQNEADQFVTLYDAEGEQIVNIYRAEAIRPLAETYHVMGNPEAALSVYKRAVEAGVENPNSRPRAEDLSATCNSMALHAVKPDAELWARMQQIYKGLDHPW